MTANDAAGLIFAGMNNRDLSALETHLIDDALFDFPGPGAIQGKRRIIIFLKVLFRKYSRLTFTVDEIIDGGDTAVAVWHNEGITAQGAAYANRGVTVVRMSGGAISYISDYFKDTSFTLS